jgi:anti-anti-sigma regulatory factor
MEDTTLQVTARPSAAHELVLAVEGYLDEDGGLMLARKTRAVPAAEHRRIRIDLDEVRLFNCSGARQLIALLADLDQLGYEVDLVGVHLPLRRLLDLTA